MKIHIPKYALSAATLLLCAVAFGAAPPVIAQEKDILVPEAEAADEAADPLAPVENAKIETVDADPALWLIKDEDTNIYLFGTVHILKPGLGWFDEAVKTAFDASDTLVMELPAGADAEAAQLFGKYGIDQSGKSLRDKLSAEDRAVYEAAMKKLGLPEASFDPLDPWAAGVTMQIMALTKAGYQPGSGAETILQSSALVAKKPIKGLETAEYQLGLFDSLPEETQIEFLIEAARDLDATTASLDDLVKSWAAGDPEKLAELMNAGFSDPVLFEKLLTQRNANWARWISDRMEKPGTIFIAVGAGHLSGPTSVPHLITAYGLKAERIVY
ncbi:TraB/GumN family protein [Sphingorhabdus arenilitoris]|uniref:TraB/GumN family protein n=1 Tax=Sphingorhabdus arenilitoris TaxID=1490041 RepID=A0ABV8RFY6_9SPHN